MNSDLAMSNATDLGLEYSLTEEYCRNHFLVGLLLREVAEALNGCPEIRQLGVAVLKNLMVKHALDDRYTVYKVSAGRGAYCSPGLGDTSFPVWM